MATQITFKKPVIGKKKFIGRIKKKLAVSLKASPKAVTPVAPAVTAPAAVAVAVATPINIIVSKKFGGLSEIYQSKATKFALLAHREDNNYEQITPYVQCRDFIGDVYTSTHQKADFGIYGMSWKGTQESPDMESLRLVIQFPDVASQKSFEKNIAILHNIEKQNGVSLTQYTNNKDKQGIVFADKRWLTNVLYVSLYTFLLRAFCYKIETDNWIKELGAQSHSDSKYIKSISEDTWGKILANLSLIDTPEFCAMNIKSEMRNVHHNAGFISTFGTHSEINYGAVKNNPHYKQMINNGVFVEKRF